MGPRNAYKDMLDKVVSPIACVNMNHQNQLVQMANGAMFATEERRKMPEGGCGGAAGGGCRGLGLGRTRATFFFKAL
jgi:hypothetical protein